MKKILILAVAMLFVASAAFALTIVGSDHDMTTHLAGQTLGYAEVCVYCHTPHGASTVAGYGDLLPLWNRSIGSIVFTPYNDPQGTIDAVDINADIGPQSLSCMSCHDGTISVNALVNLPNYGVAGVGDGTPLDAITGNIIAGGGLLDTDLSNDHPVGFTYPVTDAELVALAVVQLDPDVALFGAASDQVECSSCHDVHDNAFQPFLISSNAASALCLQCHIK